MDFFIYIFSVVFLISLYFLGGGRGRGRREEGRGRGRPQVTAEDLDKELDAYRNKMETD